MAMHRAPVGGHGSTRCASNGARSCGRGVNRSLNTPSRCARRSSTPPLTSRRLEIRLTTLLGAGFGLGIALTLSRLVAGLTPGLAASGMVAGVAIGLAVTAWVVNARALLHDRVVVDRWTGEVTASLRSVVEQLVATRVVAVETLLSTAISERDDAENARVADQVSIIDGELREHAVAAARAAALRDREMPAVRAALEAVRAELGEPGTPTTGLF